VFHRVDDPMSLPSSRYFQFAERLKFYDGAVRAALLTEAHPPLVEPGAGEEVASAPVIDDVSLIAELSDHPGFPGIEYVTGG